MFETNGRIHFYTISCEHKKIFNTPSFVGLQKLNTTAKCARVRNDFVKEVFLHRIIFYFPDLHWTYSLPLLRFFRVFLKYWFALVSTSYIFLKSFRSILFRPHMNWRLNWFNPLITALIGIKLLLSLRCLFIYIYFLLFS